MSKYKYHGCINRNGGGLAYIGPSLRDAAIIAREASCTCDVESGIENILHVMNRNRHDGAPRYTRRDLDI